MLCLPISLLADEVAHEVIDGGATLRFFVVKKERYEELNEFSFLGLYLNFISMSDEKFCIPLAGWKIA